MQNHRQNYSLEYSNWLRGQGNKISIMDSFIFTKVVTLLYGLQVNRMAWAGNEIAIWIKYKKKFF
jgi:hypothetical protein